MQAGTRISFKLEFNTKKSILNNTFSFGLTFLEKKNSDSLAKGYNINTYPPFNTIVLTTILNTISLLRLPSIGVIIYLPRRIQILYVVTY